MAYKTVEAKDVIEKFKYALENKWGYIWGKAGVMFTEAMYRSAVNEQTKLYGRRWIGRYVADCSGLFRWAYKELGSYMYHGSNTMWKSYCVDKGNLKSGKRTDGKTLKPGTAVFTDHDGDKTHVGLYIGGGTVIEASGTKVGVITSKITAAKWKCWGELKYTHYGVEEEAIPVDKPVDTDVNLPTLRKGSKGQYVALLQTLLINRGYSLPKYGADGDFGNETFEAVKQFQKDWNMDVDGIVGPKTWKLLESVPEKQRLYTVTIWHLSRESAESLLKTYSGAMEIE